MKFLAFIVSFFASLAAFADDHGGAPAVGDGAFVALMVQAKDPDAYIAMMKANSAPLGLGLFSRGRVCDQNRCGLSGADVCLECF